jgi:hypothetical protein
VGLAVSEQSGFLPKIRLCFLLAVSLTVSQQQPPVRRIYPEPAFCGGYEVRAPFWFPPRPPHSLINANKSYESGSIANSLPAGMLERDAKNTAGMDGIPTARVEETVHRL